MAKKSYSLGVISAHEVYTKHELFLRLGISQRFWDQMLDDGLPYSICGKSRVVCGLHLLAYFQRNAKTKPPRHVQ